MRTCCPALLLLLLPAALNAQAIRGVVQEETTGAPIEGATVELLSSDSTVRASMVTLANGWFSLSPQGTGRFLVRTSHPSYRGGVREVSVSNREMVTVMVRMGRAAIPLDPVVVTARSNDGAGGFRERARHGGQGRYITRDQIEKRVANRPSDLLKLVPEVRLESIRDPNGMLTTQGVLMRSLGESCIPAIYLDGLRIPQIHEDFGFDIDQLITSDQLEGIEVYRNSITVPPELHVARNNETCGVISLWSRTVPGSRVTWKRVGTASAVLAGMLLLR